MKYAIVTGVSKGLGMSIATLLLKSKINVIGLSRHNNATLQTIAEENNVEYKHYRCDLADVSMIDKTCEEISDHVFMQDLQMIYVINNAGILQPIKQSKDTTSAEIATHMQINSVAPMIIMNYFLQKATAFGITLYGATITSGAAERPVYGWSAYCSSKASMNMYTQTVGLEQEELQTGNKVIAFSPGVMDTDMQGEIRGSNYDDFIEVDLFKDYKKNDQLQDPTVVGNVFVAVLLNETTLENGRIYEVKDYL